MSAPLYCYTAEAWLVFATVTALVTAKATAMGMRIGNAHATAALTEMATAMATSTARVMVTAKVMVIEWQQLATVMVMVMPTA